MVTIQVYKALSVGSAPVPSLEITARETIPDTTGRDAKYPDYVVQAERLFHTDAVKIVDALERCLPGGTVDQIFAELAQRKASVFRVPHFISNDAETEATEEA